MKNLTSSSLPLMEKVDLINKNQDVWKIDVFKYWSGGLNLLCRYQNKNQMITVQNLLLDVWEYFLDITSDISISFYSEYKNSISLSFTLPFACSCCFDNSHATYLHNETP